MADFGQALAHAAQPEQDLRLSICMEFSLVFIALPG